MKNSLIACVIVVAIGILGCDEAPKPDVNNQSTTVQSSITVEPRSEGIITVTVTAKVFSTSKSQALKRVAADLERMANDLSPKIDQPLPPIDPGQVEVSKSN